MDVMSPVTMVWVSTGIAKTVSSTSVALAWSLMASASEHAVIERVRATIPLPTSNLSDVGENGNKECDGDKEVLLCVVVSMVNNPNVVVVI